MVVLKRKNTTFAVLALFGLGYFNAISSLEINDFLKSEIALIPAQLACIIYMTYLLWSRRYRSIDVDN